MKRLTLAILASRIVLVASTPRPSSPVCIVGAGVSGLTTARALEDKGYETVIFEKRFTVGGKCQSHYEGDQYFPLGAVLFTNSTSYAETFKLVTTTGVKYEQYSSGEGWDFDPKTGVEVKTASLSTESAQALGAELLRYAGWWATTFAPIGVPSYKNGVPGQFAATAQQWLLSNNFTFIASIINRAAGNYGYGDYTQVPALYFLQFFAPDIIGSFIGSVQPYFTDFFEVFTRVSKTIKGPIHLGVEIIHINRKNAINVHYRNKKGAYVVKQACSDIILAFPPTVSALQGAGLQLSSTEKALFGQVGTNNYFASAVRLDKVPAGVVLSQELANPLAPFDPEGQPVYSVSLHANSSIKNVYSADKPGKVNSEENVTKHLIQDLSKLNKDPKGVNQASEPISAKDIRGFSGQVDYFPHVGPKALLGGWYGQFNNIQGKDHTYFTSGLNSFELVEYTLRAAQDLVETHF